ncbi:defensin-like protein isoform X1 [Lycium barbarum]|uniref:defensin-like protein isoform X1 n=1 Tax=Lycium barbarum TaxID=112863 RepID=UPI00293EE6BB|nr:defensin-like protein isoform X1 [Lycium barbarum]
MGSALRFFATFFLVTMLLLANEMGPMRSVEARLCESKSHRFKGKCLSDTNCGSVCQTEGFTGGNCRGFRQRCFCTRNC